MYDERASALFDESGDNKAIAKNDMLFFDQKNACLSVDEDETLNATYALVENWIPLKDVTISFRLDVKTIGIMDVLTLKRNGYVRLTPDHVKLHLVTEGGEFDIDMSIDYPKGLTSLSLYFHNGKVGVSFDQYHQEVDLPEHCHNGLEAAGFFGHISQTSAHVIGISVEPQWVAENTIEKLQTTLVDEVAKSVDKKIMHDLMGFTATTTQFSSTGSSMSDHIAHRRRIMGIPKSGLGPPSVEDKAKFDSLSFPLIRSVLPQLISNSTTSNTSDTMGETILAYLTRITGLNEEALKVLDRKELIRLVYNGIANDPVNVKVHHEILKEAHYAAARFLDGDQSLTTPDVSIGDKTYNTFEFGEVNRINCTPQRLLYLVKTYPEVWLKRLV